MLLINNNYIYFVVLVKYNKILYPKAKLSQQFWVFNSMVQFCVVQKLQKLNTVNAESE